MKPLAEAHTVSTQTHKVITDTRDKSHKPIHCFLQAIFFYNNLINTLNKQFGPINVPLFVDFNFCGHNFAMRKHITALPFLSLTLFSDVREAY